MQQKLNLLLARTNRIALQLNLKENDINEELIDKRNDPIYYFTLNGERHYFSFNQDNNQYVQKQQEYRLCDIAIKLVEKGIHIRNLYWRRSKLLIEQALMKSNQLQSNENLCQNIPIQTLQQLDLQNKANRNKIKQMIIETYHKNPQDLRKLSISLKLSNQQIRQWIKKDDRSKKRLLLREQVVQKGLQQRISLSQFKSIARRIYRSKQFRATDIWCLNFIHKYKLLHVVVCNQDQKEQAYYHQIQQ